MRNLITRIGTKSAELKRHLNKKLLLMLVGNFATILINIAIVKILTNKYTTTDFGIYSLIVSFTVLPQLVLFAPIAASIFPFINVKKDEFKYEMFQKDLFELFFLVMSLLIVLLISIFCVSIFLSVIPIGLVYIISLSIFFSTTLSWLSMLDTFSLANHRVKEYTVFPLMNLGIKLICLLLIFNVDLIPQTLILIFSLIQLLFCFVELFYLQKNGVITYKIRFKLLNIFTVNTKSKIEILSYSKNFFIWGLFGWSQSFLDKWILNYYHSSGVVGIYAVYYQYGFFPFTIFSSIISQYITPLYFSKLSNKHLALSFLKKLLVFCIIFLIGFCCIMFVLSYYLAPFFIELFTNANYLEFINLFPIIVLAGCFFGFGQIITVPLLNSEFVGKIRIPKVVTAVLAIVLFWLLAPVYGLAGVLTSLFFSNIFYFVSLMLINMVYVKRLQKEVLALGKMII